jgi:hypothetical protein
LWRAAQARLLDGTLRNGHRLVGFVQECHQVRSWPRAALSSAYPEVC